MELYGDYSSHGDGKGATEETGPAMRAEAPLRVVLVQQQISEDAQTFTVRDTEAQVLNGVDRAVMHGVVVVLGACAGWLWWGTGRLVPEQAWWWPWVWLHAACGLCMVWRAVAITGRVREESVSVLRNLGVQLSTTTVLGRQKLRFIERSKVVELVINEGIHRMQVKFYMALVVAGEPRLVVLFPELLPRLPVLRRVFTPLRNVIGLPL